MSGQADVSTRPRNDQSDRASLLAAAIDQKRIGLGAQSWVVHVLGVHNDGRDLWIQVAPDDTGRDAFVLQLSPYATLEHALAALESARSAVGTFPHIVPVMQDVARR